MSAQNIMEYRKKKNWISDKLADSAKIEEIAESTSKIDAALARLEADYGKETEGLPEIAADAAVAAEVSFGERDPALKDWHIQKANVVIENSPAAAVARFIAESEKQRPPWRVSACELRALEGMPGAVRATISMKALRK